MDKDDLKKILQLNFDEDQAGALANIIHSAKSNGSNGLPARELSQERHSTMLVNILIGVVIVGLLALFGFIYSMNGRVIENKHQQEEMQKDLEEDRKLLEKILQKVSPTDE